MDFSQLANFTRENSELIGALAAGSICFAVAGALLGPFIIARLPEDYFSQEAMSRRQELGLGPRALFLRILRNVAGWPLLILGVALLVLPGQGILTIVAALALMDFPMKRRLMQKLLETQRVRGALDWLRRVSGKKPFLWD